MLVPAEAIAGANDDCGCEVTKVNGGDIMILPLWSVLGNARCVLLNNGHCKWSGCPSSGCRMPPTITYPLEWETRTDHFPSNNPVYDVRWARTMDGVQYQTDDYDDANTLAPQYWLTLPGSDHSNGRYWQFSYYDSNLAPYDSEIMYVRAVAPPSQNLANTTLWWLTTNGSSDPAAEDPAVQSYRLELTELYGDQLEYSYPLLTGMQHTIPLKNGAYAYSVYAVYADGSEQTTGVPQSHLVAPQDGGVIASVGLFSASAPHTPQPARTIQWNTMPGAVEYTLLLARNSQNFVDSEDTETQTVELVYSADGTVIGTAPLTTFTEAPLLLKQAHISSTSYDISQAQLAYGTDYFVRIEGRDSAGVTRQVSQCEFSIGTPRDPWAVVVKIDPSADAYAVIDCGLPLAPAKNEKNEKKKYMAYEPVKSSAAPAK